MKTEHLTAARKGQPVKIEAEGHTFYLLSQQAYDALEKADDDVMTKDEMDVLADEVDAYPDFPAAPTLVAGTFG